MNKKNKIEKIQKYKYRYDIIILIIRDNVIMYITSGYWNSQNCIYNSNNSNNQTAIGIVRIVYIITKI